MENFHPVPKCKIVSEPKHLNYVVIRIDMQKDKDIDKGNLFLLVIPGKYEPIILNTYHDTLLAGHKIHVRVHTTH